MSTLREEIPLRTRKILKKSFGLAVTTTVIGAVVSVILFAVITVLRESEISGLSPFLKTYQPAIAVGWFGLLLVLILWSPIYEYLYLRLYFYDLDDDNLIIRKGVVVKHEITLPFNKITDVWVDQDVLDTVLGLYDVHFSTPTQESGRFAHIDGLNKRDSVRLKKLILSKLAQDNAAEREKNREKNIGR